MKRSYPKVLVLLLLLPLVLSACGGDKAGNAEKFLNAAYDGDLDEAEKYICDDQKDELRDENSEFTPPEGFEVSDISCEEDGDNVKCSMNMTFGGETQNLEMTLIMDGDKVCDLEVSGP